MIFSWYSTPELLHSDQGTQFQYNLIAEVCVILRIKKLRTTPYYPQCYGLVLYNSKIEPSDMLANHPHNWEKHLTKGCLAYNTSVHETTGYLPLYLTFGSQARLPNYCYCVVLSNHQPMQLMEYLHAEHNTLANGRKPKYDTSTAHYSTKAKHESQKELYFNTCIH